MAARRRGRGGSGPLLAVLALGVVLAGLVYVFWDQIKTRILPEPAVVEPDTSRDRSVSLPTERKREPEPTRAVEPEPEAVARGTVEREPVRITASAAERARARAQELHAEAEEALRALEFDKAAELFGREAGELGHDPSASDRAKALARKAVTFAKVTKGVEPNPVAAGGLVTLRRHSGNDIEDVVLVDETMDSYVIARRGMEFNIRRDTVSAVERITPEMQRKRLLAEFARLERKSAGDSASAHFALAERAYKDGLEEKALAYLEKAYAKSGDDLPVRIRQGEAKKKLRLAFWCESTGRTSPAISYCRQVERNYRDFPDLVAEARELRDRIENPPVAVARRESTVRITVTKASPSSSSGSSSASSGGSTPSARDEKVSVHVQEVTSRSSTNSRVVDEINAAFEQGMDHYVKGRPGSPNSNAHLGKAAQLFDKVVALCGRALQSDPGNNMLKNRQADASRFAYHSRKMKTLGMF